MRISNWLARRRRGKYCQTTNSICSIRNSEQLESRIVLTQLQAAWLSTAAQATVPDGAPVQLSWSIAQDGTPIPAVQMVESSDPSDLISVFDMQYGAGTGGNDLTQRPWFSLFDDSFQRISSLAGISFTFEPNDDGFTGPAPIASNSPPGVTGIRGDIRIDGHLIDGPAGGPLAYNYYPVNGGHRHR